MSQPIAKYVSPDLVTDITVGDGPHTTNGITTGPSAFVLEAGQVDLDKPTEGGDTYLSGLRRELTTLQDKLNIMLTERMESAKKISKEKEEELAKAEAKLLDGGDDDEDE